MWESKTVVIPVYVSNMDTDLLHKRCADSFGDFQRQLSRTLYGDEAPYVPPTRWERFKDWLADNRVTNAWLVLIGREDIDRGYY